jgi:hypothetical protein
MAYGGREVETHERIAASRVQKRLQFLFIVSFGEAFN